MGFRNILWLSLGLSFLVCSPGLAGSKGIAPDLPKYDLDIQLDLDQHQAVVRQRVVWTNRHSVPTNEVVFNVHSHFKLPDKDIPYTAKMLEILRIAPSAALDTQGH